MEQVERGLGEKLLRVEAEQAGFEPGQVELEQVVPGVDDRAGALDAGLRHHSRKRIPRRHFRVLHGAC